MDQEAPWHKESLATVDLSDLSYSATDEEVETHLQGAKFAQECAIKKDVARLLSESSLETIRHSVGEIVGKISGTSKNDLIHYIALRRQILEILGKSLETG